MLPPLLPSQRNLLTIYLFVVIYIDPDTTRSYTYAQVRSTALDFGKGLKALWDWKKGDVLALFTPNCIDTPAVTWGTHWTGGIISPANPGYTAGELAFQLKDSGAKALVTQKAFLKTAQDACKQAGIADDRIILMGDERDSTAKYKHFSNIRNISGATRYRKTKVDPKKDVAFLAYSSGTTGHPKGVMLSHQNIVSNVLMLKEGEGGNLSWKGGKDNQGDKILAFLPFFHIYVRTPWHSFGDLVLTFETGINLPHSPSSLQRPPPRRNAKV
jgi:4-coumarate--CoA ligase